MTTKILDCYFKMSKDEIDIEYKRLQSNGVKLWVDVDLTFPLLLNAIKEQNNNMSDQEVSILHMYFEMRVTIGYIEFKKIYPILKSGITMICLYSKNDIVNKIDKMLNLDIKILSNDYDINNSMSPACKSHYSRCYSPCTTDSLDSPDCLFNDDLNKYWN